MSQVVVEEQREIAFYDDSIIVLKANDGTIFVPLRQICDFLGVAWNGQYERLQRDPILSEMITSIRVTRTQDQARILVCLPMDFLNGWLFGINANRVKLEVRENLLRYQRECYRVLAEAFQSSSKIPQTSSEASLIQIREMGKAIMLMAEEQLEHERRITRNEGRLDAAAVVVLDIQKRLSTIERRVSPGNAISEEQAAEVAELVKAIATQFAQMDPEGGNYYQAIWSEIYRRFRVTSYKKIPQRDFAAVIEFLEAWASGYESY